MIINSLLLFYLFYFSSAEEDEEIAECAWQGPYERARLIFPCHGPPPGVAHSLHLPDAPQRVGPDRPHPSARDVGFDFHCNPADQETGVLTFGSPFLVSVKSLSEPDIELEPTDAQKRDNDQRHIEWLFRSDIPAFLAVVDKKNYTMRLYGLMPVWFLCYKGGSECGSLHIKPRLDPASLGDIGEPVRGDEIPDWPGKYQASISKDRGPRFRWDDFVMMHVSCETAQAEKPSKNEFRLRCIAEEMFSKTTAMGHGDAVAVVSKIAHVKERASGDDFL